MFRFFKCIILIASLLVTGKLFAGPDFIVYAGKELKIACLPTEAPVVHTALQLLKRDWKAVFDAQLQLVRSGGDIIVGTWGSNIFADTGVDVSQLRGKREAFLLKVSFK